MAESTPGGRRTGARRRFAVVVLAVVTGIGLLAVAVLVPAHLAGLVVDELGGSSAADPDDIEGLQVIEGLRRDHVLGPIQSGTGPPAGGPHHPSWLECGVYDVPVPEELMVHSLEHGTIWVTYRPGTDAEQVAALAAALPEEGVLSPHPDQRAPVVVTAWGRHLALTGADDERLGRFVTAFADGHTAPEPRASCHGGVTLEDTEALPGTPA